MDMTRNTSARDIDTSTSMMMMDETEDEEVKRNCFGRQHYQSSSDEESESESESECLDTKSPIKFMCEKPGSDVIKPTPMTLQRILANEKSAPRRQHHHIIHNECEFSEDESASSDDDQSFSPAEPSRIPGFLQYSKTESFDDVSSEAEDAVDDISSEAEDTDEESCEETSLVDRTTDQDVDDQDSCSTSDEETSDDEVSETEDEEEEEGREDDKEEAKVIIDWGNIDDENYCADLVSKVSDSVASESESGSLSADRIEDFITKPETSEMSFSDTEETEDVTVETAEDDYDVVKCLIEHGEDDTNSAIQPLKRVLSMQRVVNCSQEPLAKHQKIDASAPPFFPSLSLGNSAYNSRLSARRQRTDSPQLSASTEEEAVDSQLAEELIDNMLSIRPQEERDPVPLLTPPPTPVQHLSTSGQVAICEWPSNLAVDNAFTAAISLRSLSPSSLLKLEEENKDELLTSPPTYLTNRLRTVSEEISSGLTPLLNSLSVPKV